MRWRGNEEGKGKEERGMRRENKDGGRQSGRRRERRGGKRHD